MTLSCFIKARFLTVFFMMLCPQDTLLISNSILPQSASTCRLRRWVRTGGLAPLPPESPPPPSPTHFFSPFSLPPPPPPFFLGYPPPKINISHPLRLSAPCPCPYFIKRHPHYPCPLIQSPLSSPTRRDPWCTFRILEIMWDTMGIKILRNIMLSCLSTLKWQGISFNNIQVEICQNTTIFI